MPGLPLLVSVQRVHNLLQHLLDNQGLMFLGVRSTTCRCCKRMIWGLEWQPTQFIVDKSYAEQEHLALGVREPGSSNETNCGLQEQNIIEYTALGQEATPKEHRQHRYRHCCKAPEAQTLLLLVQKEDLRSMISGGSSLHKQEPRRAAHK
jgi:hypothetical protein